MTISAKLEKHEMREYYQARIKGYIKPSVNEKKQRHETFLDFELRKLSQGHRLTDDTYKEYIAERKKAILRAPDKRDVIVIHHGRRNRLKVSKSVV